MRIMLIIPIIIQIMIKAPQIQLIRQVMMIIDYCYNLFPHPGPFSREGRGLSCNSRKEVFGTIKVLIIKYLNKKYKVISLLYLKYQPAKCKKWLVYMIQIN